MMKVEISLAQLRRLLQNYPYQKSPHVSCESEKEERYWAEGVDSTYHLYVRSTLNGERYVIQPKDTSGRDLVGLLSFN